jgi:hypothetical protein
MVYISPIKIIRKRQKKNLSIIEIEYFYLYNMICIYKPNNKFYIDTMLDTVCLQYKARVQIFKHGL